MKKNNFALLKLHYLKRLLCIGLALLLCSTDAMYLHAAPGRSTGSVPLKAETDSHVNTGGTDDGADLYDEYSSSDTPYYKLTCDQSILSFGMMTQYSDSVYLPFRLTNKGDTDIDLIWFLAQDDKVFHVDQPESLHLAPGQSYEFYASVDTSYAPGTYTAVFTASDDLDPAADYGISIPMSFTIVALKPYITDVTVYPGSTTMAKGTSTSFYADVNGGNDPDLSVSWSVYNNQGAGTHIDNNGNLFVDAKESSDSLSVVATSNQDPSVFGTAYVTLTTGNHTVSVQPDPYAGGAVWGGGAVSHRSSCDVFATPNNGYEFTGWKYNNQIISTSPHYTIPSVTEDMNLTACFKQISCYVNVKKNHDKAGSVTASQNVNYGGAITLQANANSGYKFDCWKEGNNVISKDAKYTVSNITGNREFTAYFSQTQYNVSVSVTPQDTGYTAGGAAYQAGKDVTLTATAYQGYHFEKWTSGDKVLGTDTTLVLKNIQADINIVANFAKNNVKNYTITANCANAGGTISPAGASTVSEGSYMIYSITPKSGYTIAGVTVDNVPVGALNTYSFTGINANHTITASFSAIPAPTPKPSAAPAAPKPSASATPAASAAARTDSVSKADTPSSGSSSTDISGSASADTSSTPDAELPSSDGSTIGFHEHEELEDPTTPEEYDAQTGVFQLLNITPGEAREAIANGEDAHLLKLAFDQDYIMVNIHNEYAATDNPTTGSHYTSCGDNFPNMEEVVYGLLNEDDKMCAFEGNQVSFNFTMYSTNDYPTAADKQIEKVCDKQNFSVGELFEILMVKTVHGDTQVVREFSTPLKVTMKIPDSLKENGRAFCIVRSHAEDDGSLSISFLQDLDDDPDTITFETDQLSSYAIAYQGGKEGLQASTIIKIVIGILLAVIVTTLLIGIISSIRHGSRRKNRRR